MNENLREPKPGDLLYGIQGVPLGLNWSPQMIDLSRNHTVVRDLSQLAERENMPQNIAMERMIAELVRREKLLLDTILNMRTPPENYPFDPQGKSDG